MRYQQPISAIPIFWVLWGLLFLHYLEAEAEIIIYEHGICVKYLWLNRWICWEDITGVHAFGNDTVVYTKGIGRCFLVPRLHIRSYRVNKKQATEIIWEKLKREV